MNINIYLENKKSIQTHKLKILLIEQNIFPRVCNKCKRTKWLNQPISLQLHHNDGNNKNNNLDNLQLLCPNCHSQTPNYCGKNKKRKVVKIVSDDTIITAIKSSFSRRQALLKIGLIAKGANYERINKLIKLHDLQFLEKPISEKEKIYREKRIQTIEDKFGSFANLFQSKIDWPDASQLEIMLQQNSCSAISKQLGVSTSAVRKKVKQYGLDMQAISPWAVKHGSNSLGGT